MSELIARVLEPSDSERWEKLATEFGTVFNTLKWTGQFGKRLTRVGLYTAHGELCGGFSVFEQRKYGLRLLINPPFTPQTGPFLAIRASNPAKRNGEIRAAIEAMMNYIISRRCALASFSLSQGVMDCLPFRWNGFKAVPSYTYRLQLDGNVKVEQAYSKSRRSSIATARRSGVSCRETDSAGEVRDLVVASLVRQSVQPDLAALDRILETFPPGRGAYAFVAQDGLGPAACAYVINDATTAYYLLGGFRDDTHVGSGALALHQAIEKTATLGLKVFDFEGSSIPSIEHYFRGFGGELVPVFRVNRAWFPIECMLKVTHRHLF